MYEFLADENIGTSVVSALRAEGFDVLLARDACGGSKDEIVLALSRQQGRILITEDNDFGELAFRRKLPTTGIVVLHLTGMKAKEQGPYVVKALRKASKPLHGHFTIIEHGRVRQRLLRM